ncbi:group II intron maturase-specific domain-containing protein [Niallia circulans]
MANIALHGMEKELGVKYIYNKRDGYILDKNSVAITRYADDFVILCKTQEEAISMYEKLKPYLSKRGLVLAEEKTKITNITDGFDFLGFNLKQYSTKDGLKLLIKPSNASIKKAKQTIKETFMELKGRPVRELIYKLNPIIRGTGYYWSSVVSKKIYNEMDHYIWIKIMKHLRNLHPKKSWKWRIARYFKPDHTGVSKDKWILTDPQNERNQITKMTWIPITRHVMVKFTNSPDNPSLRQYFEKRDEKQFNRFNINSRQKIAKKQKYKCRVCKQSLVGEESLETNHKVPKMLGGKDEYYNFELLHTSCHTQHHQLLEKYGGGKQLNRIREYFRGNNVEPSSKEGIRLIEKAFTKFNYITV